MKTWYEVFENNIDGTGGTYTLAICETLTEARKERKRYLKRGLWTAKELHIDKWENIDNPICIGEVI